jgi:hypothetical protein
LAGSVVRPVLNWLGDLTAKPLEQLVPLLPGEDRKRGMRLNRPRSQLTRCLACDRRAVGVEGLVLRPACVVVQNVTEGPDPNLA